MCKRCCKLVAMVLFTGPAVVDLACRSALELELQCAESERDALGRAVQALEEALRNRNIEVKALVERCAMLETSMLHMQRVQGGSSPLKAPTWEADSCQPVAACRWLQAITCTITGIESCLTDLGKSVGIRLQEEAREREARNRQIKVLDGKLFDLDRRHRRELDSRELDLCRIVEHCEVLGKAHLKILERELQEARKADHVLIPRSVILERAQQQPDRDPQLLNALQACGEAKVASSHGLKAVLDQSGRALASAWASLQEQDAKCALLQSSLASLTLEKQRYSSLTVKTEM